MVDKGSRENGRLLDPILDMLGSAAGGSGKISTPDRRIIVAKYRRIAHFSIGPHTVYVHVWQDPAKKWVPMR